MPSPYGHVQALKRQAASESLFNGLTVGTVVDTNDPQQMGRLRVFCTALGDTQNKLIKDMPWAAYVSPLAGADNVITRGTDGDETVGFVGYGMWNVPKIGAQVLIACIDGDTNHRIWLGCLYGQYLTHTLPHGRFTYKDADQPAGPISSSEEPKTSQIDELV